MSQVGYAVPVMPQLASYRLRVAIPAPHIGMPYQIGCTGRPTFFFKDGNPRLAEALNGVVYDVVNDHFRGDRAKNYHAMCSIADRITCASVAMAEIVHHYTGRDAVVIDDPYENEERPAAVVGEGVLWFGHSANVASLLPHIEAIGPKLIVCSNIRSAHVPWSLENESRCLQGAAVVVLTSASSGASANRVVKGMRSGRFICAPSDCPQSWRELAEYIFIGDVAEGVRWALNNREEACRKIQAGQDYIRQRFSPQSIGSQWGALFGSTSAAVTSTRRVGSLSIST